MLKAVKRLLHDEGLTIKGVQRLYKEQGIKRIAAWGDPDGLVSFEPEGVAVEAPAPQPVAETASAPVSTVRLRQVLAELEGARARLEAALTRSA